MIRKAMVLLCMVSSAIFSMNNPHQPITSMLKKSYASTQATMRQGLANNQFRNEEIRRGAVLAQHTEAQRRAVEQQKRQQGKK